MQKKVALWVFPGESGVGAEGFEKTVLPEQRVTGPEEGVVGEFMLRKQLNNIEEGGLGLKVVSPVIGVLAHQKEHVRRPGRIREFFHIDVKNRERVFCVSLQIAAEPAHVKCLRGFGGIRIGFGDGVEDVECVHIAVELKEE